MLGRRQFLGGVAVSLSAVACADQAPATPSKRVSQRTSARKLSAQDLEDALVGSSYLGCGGGGSLAEARALLAGDLDRGLSFEMIGVEDLSDGERVACPYALSSLAPLSDALSARLEALGGGVAAPVEEAFKLLEKQLEVSFGAVILGEIGPLSMAEGLSIAARLGVPALDADTVGRATPEINQHSVRVAGYPLTPAAGVTLFGDQVVLEKVADPSREEDVFRGLAVVSGVVGVADAAITGAEAKKEGTLITESLSLAMNLGRAVRQAKAQGEDPINAARVAGDGYSLFRGTVERFDWQDEDGFLAGNLTLAGAGDDAGQQLVLDYKNEHLVARRNGEVVATCPDLITMVDEVTAEGVNNPDFEVGQRVEVLGFRCDPVWRTPAGLNVFEPRYFGYDVDYIPIERRLP